MNNPAELKQLSDDLCTITLTRPQALLVMGNFNLAMKQTERHLVRGLCSAADLESETVIAAELQRQILFRLPPSVVKGGGK